MRWVWRRGALAGVLALGMALPLACDESESGWYYPEYQQLSPAWGPGSYVLPSGSSDLVVKVCTFLHDECDPDPEALDFCIEAYTYFYSLCPQETELRLFCTLEEYSCMAFQNEGSDIARCVDEEIALRYCLAEQH